MPLNVSLAVSLALHTFCFLLLLGSLRFSAPPVSGPIIVELAEEPRNKAEKKPVTPAPRAAGAGRGLHAGTTKSTIQHRTSNGWASLAGTRPAPSAPAGNGSVEAMAGEVGRAVPVRQVLYDRVNQALGFPADLLATGRPARVSFRREVRADGRVTIGEALGATDAATERWARAAIEAANARPLPAPGRSLEFSLNFALNPPERDAAPPIVGQALSFARSLRAQAEAPTGSQANPPKTSAGFHRSNDTSREFEVRFDPIALARFIFAGGAEKRAAEERRTLEEELAAAREKRRRQER